VEEKPEEVPEPVPEVKPEPVKPKPVVAKSAPSVEAPPVEAVPTEDGLTREAKWLAQAHATLASDPGTTLRLLDEHARLFPNGQMADERELLAVDALRRLGRKTEARTRGEAMLAKNPSGLYADRVRALLAPLP